MECLNCNKEILLNAKFCPECGVKITEFEAASKEEGVLVNQVIETLDQIKEVKTNESINTTFDKINEATVPKRDKGNYFIFMLASLVFLPGLHRIYMKAYKSGLLMLGLMLMYFIEIEYPSVLPFKGKNDAFVFVLIVYLVQFCDLFRFNDFNNRLKESYDPVYRRAAMERRSTQDAIDRVAKAAKEAKEAKDTINRATKKAKDDVDRDYVKRILTNSTGKSVSEEKVARSTCTKCHLIKPRTEMKLVTKKRRSGSSIGYGFKSKNVSVRAYTSNTQVWVCDKCRSWW